MNKLSSKYLHIINTPDDLKKLSINELQEYCRELRDYIINEVSRNPGHLGSSLGTVELAVALHYVYDTPSDKLIWDVGHQAYAHKIITGRRDQFPTNRSLGGISGFPRMSESEYDAFGAGHASTSISAALGMAIAARLTKSNQKVVAVIGDGAMSGGLAFEGLNNAGFEQADLLVILNDNNISIDPNVGALKEYFLGLTTSRGYNRLKARVWDLMSPWPRFRRICQKIEHGAKSFFLHQSNLFESLNFRYFGPTDGNDVKALVRALYDLKEIGGAKIFHILTQKGHGYKPAQDNQTAWHAPGKFNPKTGEKAIPSDRLRYQDVFGHTLLELARRNIKIVGVTPAMPTGCSMNIMMCEIPDRSFDVGIAEGHAVTFSGGMAAAGLIPFCNIYSSFSQRSIDNIVHDISLQQLEVVICLDRAGLVGEDGATHHGIFDIPMLRAVPNTIIAAPSNAIELRNLMYTASLGGYRACFVIRYPRGGDFSKNVLNEPMQRVEIGRGRTIIERQDGGVAILSLGDTFDAASEVASETGASHYDMLFVKPLDEALLDHIVSRSSRLITLENGALAGGFGSACVEYFARRGYSIPVTCLGIGDDFIEHGTLAELHAIAGIDAAAIRNALKKQVHQ